MPKSERLLTVQEAEEMTGRKASTWRRDILLRKIDCVRIGRSVRIPIETIYELIASGWSHQIELPITNERPSRNRPGAGASEFPRPDGPRP